MNDPYLSQLRSHSTWESEVALQCSSHKFGNPFKVFLPHKRLYRSTPLLKEMHKLLPYMLYSRTSEQQMMFITNEL